MRTGAVEAVAAGAVLQDELARPAGSAIGPPWHSTMMFRVDAARRRRPGVDPRHAVLERQRRLAPIAPPVVSPMWQPRCRRRPRSWRARLLSLNTYGVVSRSSSWARRIISTSSAVAHAGLFQIRAERAVDQADGGKVLHARKAEARSAGAGSGPAIMNGSVPLTPASTGVCLTTGSTSRAISQTMSLALP